MTIKTHQNYSGLLYLQHKHRVKKLEKFINQVKSYGRAKFRKNEVFVSKRVTSIDDIPSLSRGHFFAKNDPCSNSHNFRSVIGKDFI